MQVEKIRIIAKELGVQDLCMELIYALEKCDGHFAITKKGNQRDLEEYEPVVVKLRKKISELLLIRIPEFKGWTWGVGRLKDNVCYITVYNPEWLPAKEPVSGE